MTRRQPSCSIYCVRSIKLVADSRLCRKGDVCEVAPCWVAHCDGSLSPSLVSPHLSGYSKTRAVLSSGRASKDLAAPKATGISLANNPRDWSRRCSHSQRVDGRQYPGPLLPPHGELTRSWPESAADPIESAWWPPPGMPLAALAGARMANHQETRSRSHHPFLRPASM